MDIAGRCLRYFRTPLVVCGTTHTVSSTCNTQVTMADLSDSFYGLFGRSWGHIRTVKELLNSDRFIDEALFDSSKSKTAESSGASVANVERRMFEMLLLPSLRDRAHVFTANLESLLNEGKHIVPFILNTLSDEEVCSRLQTQHHFTKTASARGQGFTCTVYKKDSHLNTPVYVISGDLDISVDEFHALACDTEFRKEWDDQFHSVQSEHIDSNIHLLQWVVKWPWPLAPREYNYLLAPHALDDGTKLVLAASVDQHQSTNRSIVPVREYFGITAAKPIGERKCRYCLYYFDDPRLPGKMPAWVESYVASTLLPSFPRKILSGAQKYPKERLLIFSTMATSM